MMLQQLSLKNFGIIAEATLAFHPGFTVVTGETGAGKSLIIDAISLLTGRPGGDDWIKTGATEAVVEGVFELRSVPSRLSDLVDVDGVCIVQRRLIRGRSGLAKINNNTVNLKFLKEAMVESVQLVGQHDMFALFKQEDQRRLLDQFVQQRPEAKTLLDAYSESYREYLRLIGLLDIDDQAQTKWERDAEFLRFQLAELSKYHLDPDEELALIAQKHQFKRQYALSQLADGVVNHADQAVAHFLDMVQPLEKMAELDAALKAASEQLYTIRVSTEELQQQLARLLASIPRVSDADFDAIESRLDVLLKLRLKYRVGTIAELCDRKKTYETELAELEAKQSDIATAKTQLAAVTEKLVALAEPLTALRREVARDVAGRVQASLRDLQFLQSHFEISIQPEIGVFGPYGWDSIQFLLSVNPGDVPKPIEKTASGGEISRVFLALKTVFHGQSVVPLMIFDEVDTGIGGLTAGSVGAYLSKLATPTTQVLCVTHLPQIAMQAQHHIHVQKYQDAQETRVHLRSLDALETKQELQRMMGGDTVIQEILR